MRNSNFFFSALANGKRIATRLDSLDHGRVPTKQFSPILPSPNQQSAPVLILRARGPQDVNLIVNPEVTFFVSKFARHSNFAFEDLEIQQNAGSSDWGQEVTFQLTRSGDLVSQCMLAFDIQKVTARSTEESKLHFSTGGAVADATVQSKTSPYWEKVGTEWVYKKKMFVDDLARAVIDRVSLTIGGYEVSPRVFGPEYVCKLRGTFRPTFQGSRFFCPFAGFPLPKEVLNL